MLFFIYIDLFILPTIQNLRNFVSGKRSLIFPLGGAVLVQWNPIDFLRIPVFLQKTGIRRFVLTKS